MSCTLICASIVSTEISFNVWRKSKIDSLVPYFVSTTTFAKISNPSKVIVPIVNKFDYVTINTSSYLSMTPLTKRSITRLLGV
jgi:hypothetical protein